MGLQEEYTALKTGIANYEREYTQLETRQQMGAEVCNRVKAKYNLETPEELEALIAKATEDGMLVVNQTKEYLEQCNKYITGVRNA